MNRDASLGKALHAARPARRCWRFTLFPFYWMVSSSLKDQTDLLASPPVWTFVPTLAHYAESGSDDKVVEALLNSLIVAGCTTVLAIALGTPAAYALARFEFRGKKDLWFWFISNRMISPIVLALPVYLMAQSAGLLDTHLVLILIYLIFCLPIVVWICTDQFRSIPPDLEQAARLDDANQWDIFWRIYLPLGAAGHRGVGDLQLHLLVERTALRARADAQRRADRAGRSPRATCRATNCRGARSWRPARVIVLPVTVFALLVSRHMVRGLTMGATK